MADSTLVWAATRPADGGTFYGAPLGTTLPTDATTALNATFLANDHGWLTDDGYTNGMKRTTTKHYSFGGDVIKVTQDRYEESLQLTLAETNEAVLKTVFGDDSVTVDDSGGHRTIEISHNSLPLERKCYVAEMIDGEKTRRLVIKEGQVTEIADVKYVQTDLVQYRITVDCFKPDDGSDAVVEYVDEADVLAGS